MTVGVSFLTITLLQPVTLNNASDYRANGLRLTLGLGLVDISPLARCIVECDPSAAKPRKQMMWVSDIQWMHSTVFKKKINSLLFVHLPHNGNVTKMQPQWHVALILQFC